MDLVKTIQEDYSRFPENQTYSIYAENITRWTMSWNSPLPWQPFISVSGRSELKVQDNLIVAHYDYWDCSIWDVVKQHFK